MREHDVYQLNLTGSSLLQLLEAETLIGTAFCGSFTCVVSLVRIIQSLKLQLAQEVLRGKGIEFNNQPGKARQLDLDGLEVLCEFGGR